MRIIFRGPGDPKEVTVIEASCFRMFRIGMEYAVVLQSDRSTIRLRFENNMYAARVAETVENAARQGLPCVDLGDITANYHCTGKAE